MTNKPLPRFTVGESAIVVERNDQYKHFEVTPVIVESVIWDKDGISYWFKNFDDQVLEKDVFTLEQALEFLSRNLKEFNGENYEK